MAIVVKGLTELTASIKTTKKTIPDYASKIEFGEPIGGNPKTQDDPKRATPTGPRPYMRPAFDTQSKRLEDFYKRRTE